jgi:hypothetical protein
MITESYKTVTPAYGRDYKSKATVEKDFRDGKDFYLEPEHVLCSIRDFEACTVNLRYNKLRSVHPVKV